MLLWFNQEGAEVCFDCEEDQEVVLVAVQIAKRRLMFIFVVVVVVVVVVVLRAERLLEGAAGAEGGRGLEGRPPRPVACQPSPPIEN